MTSQEKLIVVSNRLPIALKRNRKGWDVEVSGGGLATALAGLRDELDFLWVGWPGTVVRKDDQLKLCQKLKKTYKCHPIFLRTSQVDRFYNGFCNSVIWPLFHYLPSRVDFSLPYWDEYKAVNQQFADEILKVCEENTTIWIHDFHLFLLPALLRKKRPDLKIGFFLHIPFPSSEIYKLLPVREELLQGILGSDLVGFQTHDYVRHFGSTCLRVLGMETTPTEVHYEDRRVLIGCYPIGINAKEFISRIHDTEVIKSLSRLEKTYKAQTVILGVDRLDYIKGLVQKFNAFEFFLEQYPKFRGKVVLVQIAVPSRMNVRAYDRLKQELDQITGKINGRFGTPGYVPIHYFAQSVDSNELHALYQLADVMLITSIRDGMNLVSLEYTACQSDRHGVLVLSEFAGAANALSQALIVNPWDFQEVANNLHRALTMEKSERVKRTTHNLKYVRDFHSFAWAGGFIRDLQQGATTGLRQAKDLKASFITLKRKYSASKDRLLFLDYDGTLVPFVRNPADAHPGKKLISLLTQFSESGRTEVQLISGRPKEILSQWLDGLRVGLSAEHGMFYKSLDQGSWVRMNKESDDWMGSVEPILQDYTRRVPGSLVEKKESSLSWHYREADPEFGNWQAHELAIHLDHTLSNLPVAVVQGNKVVEIRHQGISKGTIVKYILETRPKIPDIILCFGDDRTDEDMFASLPSSAWTCRIGNSHTQAKYFLERHEEAIEILEELAMYP